MGLTFSLLALASIGCTSMSLKRQSLRHAESAVDLRYREVVENLAILAANPGMLPAFSTIYFGTTNVTDTIPFNANNAATVAKLGAPTTYSFTMDFPLSRQVTQNWSLDPTVVPEKLRAIRCACWWMLYGPNCQIGDCSSLYAYAQVRRRGITLTSQTIYLPFHPAGLSEGDSSKFQHVQRTRRTAAIAMSGFFQVTCTA